MAWDNRVHDLLLRQINNLQKAIVELRRIEPKLPSPERARVVEVMARLQVCLAEDQEALAAPHGAAGLRDTAS